MDEFDDTLRSKLESFDAGLNPSSMEIDRMNQSLDLLAQSRFKWRRLFWVLPILLFLGSQIWLVYDNYLLRNDLRGALTQISTLETSQTESRADLRKSAILLQKTRDLLMETHSNSVYDPMLHSSDLSGQGQISDSKELQQAILAQLQSTIKSDDEATSKSTRQNQRENGIAGNGRTTSKSDEIESKGLISSGGVDTVIIRETMVLDSSIFESLYNQIEELRPPSMDKESLQPLLKTPLPFAWTVSFGFRPGYSNLYLIDGRLVYDAHIVTGIEINDRLALNVGIKYKTSNFNENIELSHLQLNQVEGLPTDVIELGQEIEGKIHGVYLPVDLRYTADIGNFRPYIRVGSDINFYGCDNLRIEYGDHEQYHFDRLSRKLMISNVSFGIGSTASLGNHAQLYYEGGYLIGNPNSLLVLSERNGLYIQLRLGLDILSK